jgi:glycosyltransferase involved in cell wall biosynthesis
VIALVERSRLVILDDVFPLPLSAFRYTEYTQYLQHVENSKVYSNGACLKLLGEKRQITDVIAEFDEKCPHMAGRVLPYTPGMNLGQVADLVYFIFLGNARNFKQDLIESNRPFIFTLYPGGSFEPFQEKTNALLREIMALPGFRKVIVTQPFVRDYLINGSFCRSEQIVLIPGVVVPEEFLQNRSAARCAPANRANGDSNVTVAATTAAPAPAAPAIATTTTTNICFAAFKYLPDGKEKGYDIFINVARRLLSANKDLRFHIVGGFEPGDVDDQDIRPFLNFRGRMTTDELLSFFATMDILISPNRAGVPTVGKFDGFPTGAAVQAALQGVAVFASDSLRQNFYLRDREEIVVTSHSAKEIAELVEIYINDRSKLLSLQEAGRAAFQRLYDFDAQMRPRIQLIQAELAALRPVGV